MLRVSLTCLLRHLRFNCLSLTGRTGKDSACKGKDPAQVTEERKNHARQRLDVVQIDSG